MTSALHLADILAGAVARLRAEQGGAAFGGTTFTGEAGPNGPVTREDAPTRAALHGARSRGQLLSPGRKRAAGAAPQTAAQQLLDSLRSFKGSGMSGEEVAQLLDWAEEAFGGRGNAAYM